ncbi:hypothetical protein C8N40_11195 [Pontibacter mucosus]|uniref:Uncharacterized protein n=1 Tax=Pontibacter mucosus TaxID=1649266 RepID=A0A2T5YD38_9BACT|nr:hypothetical protein [Pontibacter mucosus]PTX14430.1 hypothetical protein C8N40_11195 [Pontibacter mucosus]
MSHSVTKILILVELEDGTVRQVLASKEQKELALHFLKAETGALRVTEEVEPFELTFKK